MRNEITIAEARRRLGALPRYRTFAITFEFRHSEFAPLNEPPRESLQWHVHLYDRTLPAQNFFGATLSAVVEHAPVEPRLRQAQRALDLMDGPEGDQLAGLVAAVAEQERSS